MSENNNLKSHYKIGSIEAGCDEAGRGCLAGPVYAAAVILPDNYKNSELNDSKQLSEKKRYELREIILEEAICWTIGIVDNSMIDKINILNASILAMHQAIDNLKVRPEHLLIDGNHFINYEGIQHKCIIKGDSKYCSIAAASILAKTFRDDYMKKIHDKFPEYNWARNKGYPTSQHRSAIEKIGISKFHRKTFNLYSNQLKMEF